jgi:hypothetical protein
MHSLYALSLAIHDACPQILRGYGRNAPAQIWLQLLGYQSQILYMPEWGRLVALRSSQLAQNM